MRRIAIPTAVLLTVVTAGPALAGALAQGSGETVSQTPIFLAFILALSIFLGFELISKVPATLHTPLMSGSNAISGITLVGSLIAAGQGDEIATIVLGTVAVAAATINVVGGYLVTDRMLEMFKKKEE